MELTDRIHAIEQLLPVLYNYNKTGRFLLDETQINYLKNVYRDIYKVNVNVGCGTCLSHYLNMLQAYYEREKPTVEEIPIIEEIPVVEEPKKTKKKK